jgi:hypothetical protein
VSIPLGALKMSDANSDDSSAPVTIARFSTLQEAELAAGRLEAEEIDTSLLNENVVTQSWLYSNAVGGIQLQVPSELVSLAREILELPEPREEIDAEVVNFPTDTSCPNCGSTNVSYVQRGKRLTFLSWLLLGYPLIRFPKKLRCDSCGATWSQKRVGA